MKKACMILLVALGITAINAQVCNTGQLLRPGHFSLGVAPCIFVTGGGNDFAAYLTAGVGLLRFVDLSVNARLGERRTYFGADFEWALLKGFPSLSLTTGAHVYRQVGIDATINLTFPFRGVVSLYTGIDMDVEIRDDIALPAWFFIGPEIRIRRGLALLIELNVGITDVAPHIFVVGLGIYF